MALRNKTNANRDSEVRFIRALSLRVEPSFLRGADASSSDTRDTDDSRSADDLLMEIR